MKELILTTEAISGNPIEVTRSTLYGWHGIEYKFPRKFIYGKCPECDMLSNLTCVYILVGEKNGFPWFYIGEAENCLQRMKQHKDKDWWKEALIFVGDESKKLEKGQIKYIENVLYERAKQNEKFKRFKVSNEKTPTKSGLNHTTKLMTDDYIDFLIKITLLQNYILFQEQEHINVSNEEEILHIVRDQKILAYAKITPTGFLVKKGATILEMTEKTTACFKNYRNKLVDNGVIKGDKLTVDFEFSSPSAAAVQILGHNSNGLLEWKNVNGVKLKMLEI